MRDGFELKSTIADLCMDKMKMVNALDYTRHRGHILTLGAHTLCGQKRGIERTTEQRFGQIAQILLEQRGDIVRAGLGIE